jgi:hypothetical protein
MPHIEPTPGQLQAAFAHARKPHWPDRLDDALAHPLYGRLVRMNAMVLAEGRDPFAAQRINHRPVVIAPEPPHPAEPPAPRIERPRRPAKPRRAAPTKALPQLPLIDRKRAAGGDDN